MLVWGHVHGGCRLVFQVGRRQVQALLGVMRLLLVLELGLGLWGRLPVP